MRKLLTARQRAVFNFVRQRIYEGFPPSRREIGEHFGFSDASAQRMLGTLQKKGYIDLELGKARAIVLRPPDKNGTRHLVAVNADIPHLDLRKGDFLHIDIGKPAAEGAVILSAAGEIKRFSAGDVVFGKVVGLSRPIH